MKITRESLAALHDADAAAAAVEKVVQTATQSRLKTTLFLARYASWNGLFGSGVASLAGKIGRSQDLFLEEGMLAPLADRSVLVASYFFDAARDEFDDRDTEHRDTHRCLAQATLAGVVDLAKPDHPELSDAALEQTLRAPFWLDGLRGRVAQGYGQGSADDYAGIFRAIGYHLGSELLADKEFSIIDSSMKAHDAELVKYLTETEVTIAGQAHRCYQWIGIHSGHGGAAEADHFDWAVSGASLAFQYVPEKLHDALRRQLDAGYKAFAADHDEFFAKVLDA